MLIYWLMYLIPAIIALSLKDSYQSKLILWLSIGFFFIFIIGFRHEVGGDWFNYVRHYDMMEGITLLEALALSKGDPGHKLLNWLMFRFDWGVYGTNVVYGTVFMIGLIKFSREQMYPWLAVTVAVPYLIIVVAMGYSRQGMVIGLFLLAITYLREDKFKTYIVLILVAALFHKTALLLLPLGIFLYAEGIFFRILMIIPIVYGAWEILFGEHQGNLWKIYIEAQKQSEGAEIRVIMNLVPSLLLLVYREEWKKSFNDYSFWFLMALVSIASVGLVGFSSTAVDRIALYFIPIQLVVFSRLPYLARKQISPEFTKVIIVFGYAAVLFVWLNFASHSQYWIPYQNILFNDCYLVMNK